jgi:hypothetical protein
MHLDHPFPFLPCLNSLHRETHRAAPSWLSHPPQGRESIIKVFLNFRLLGGLLTLLGGSLLLLLGGGTLLGRLGLGRGPESL